MAQSRIKGITIQFDGETTGLDKALKSINSQAGKVGSELKDVNKLLKFDPGNAELVAQKQKLLAEQVEITAKKLEQLKSAQGQVEEQFNKGEIGVEQYRAFKRELEATEASLKSYKSQISAVEADQERLATNTKRLQTFFEATGTSVDDFADALGSKTLNAIKNGTASADQYETALNKIGKSALGVKADIGQMKNALDQVDDGNGIGQVKSDLKELGTQANKTGDDIGEMADDLKSIAVVEAADALEPITDTLKGVGEASLDAAEDVASAQVKIKTYFGLTDEEARVHGEIIESIFRDNYGDSMDAAANAVITVKKNIKDLDNESLENITKQALTLEDLFGIDMNETLRGVNSLMTTYGMTAQEAMDMVVAGTQNGLDKTNELGDNLAEYATLFEENGYSASEMFSILQAGLDGGAYNLDKVNDLVKEFGVRISDGSIAKACQDMGGNFEALFKTWEEGGGTNKELFQSIGQEIAGMSSEQEKAAAISQIFGSLGEDAGTKVIEAMTGVENKYKDVSGAGSEMQENNQNEVGQMKRNFESLALALAPIGENLAVIINAILTPLLNMLSALSDWFSTLPGPIQTFIAAFGGIVTLLLSLLPIVLAIQAAIPILTGALSALFGVIGIGLGPITLIIAAIAAVIAIIVNWESICDWFKTSWETIFNSLPGPVQTTLGIVGESLKAAYALFTGDTEGLKQSILNIYNSLPEPAQQAIVTMGNLMQASQSAIDSLMTGDTEGLKQSLLDIYNSLPEPVQNAVMTMAQYLKSAGEWADQNFVQPFRSKIQSIQDKFWEIVGGVRGAIDTIKGMMSGDIPFPHIAMPHLSVSGGWSFNPPRVPYFDIDWYAKGGVLTKPTIFGSNGGNPMGGGEAGPEAVAPISVLQEYVKSAVDGALSEKMDKMLDILLVYLPILADKETDFSLDGESLIEYVYEKMDRKAYRDTRNKKLAGGMP
ncbi:Phage-related minor tail protein [Eubacterium aggregans]|uniref:Phage-related minor tail protein n=1 Tax=Eubacterium aggregans TaxID=81409 RepID=A0A1H4BML2_9FIRM|nr:phage tail tape measure protein [Eubacterium aggregans]SEA49415.1 Phage-related minor tail protein [Eubacterium aggregans]